jgi:D-alanyl-D-alanine carboxypeptidase (penicillin-binding protein 5/6)
VKKDAPFGPVKVKRGKLDKLVLTAAEDVRVTVGKGKEKSVSVTPQLPEFVVAPVQKGQVLAKVLVQNEGKAVKEINLIASASIEKSLLPPWPVIVAVVVGLAVIGFGGLWWFRRKKY